MIPKKKLSISGVTINESKKVMKVSVDGPDEAKKKLKSKLEYNLKRISAKDAVKEKGYLKQEYEYEHATGLHWDNLRWNVSKFFLGIQTIFSIAALHGLLELGKGDVGNGKHIVDSALIVWGLIVLAVFNIVVCIIWCVRNLGIHSWHVAAIKKLRLIELDPIWKHTPWFYCGVFHIMRNREGPLGKHRTGWLECWGPPAAFCLLWIGIVILAISFSSLPIIARAIIIPLIVFLILVSIFIVKCIFCKHRKTQKNLPA